MNTAVPHLQRLASTAFSLYVKLAFPNVSNLTICRWFLKLQNFEFGQLNLELFHISAEPVAMRLQRKTRLDSCTYLDQSADHSETSQSKILERPCLACRVQERVKKQRNMRWTIVRIHFTWPNKTTRSELYVLTLQKRSSCLWVRSDALHQSQRIANSIGLLCLQQCKNKNENEV